MAANRFDGVAVFVQAAEAGSFALAAERLGVSRSAVAKTVARIERRLGARLFQRTTRRQSLTEAGQAYYERCLRAQAELEEAEAALDRGRREPRGRLRVSMPLLFGRHCAAPVLLSLAQRHPQLELELSFNDRVVDLVEEGFDLAVRIGRLHDSATLAARRLAAQTMGIGAAPAYLERHGRPRTVEELDGHVGIVYGRNGQEVPWRLRDEHGDARIPRLHSRIRMDDLQAIADAALSGIGLAWLPCWLLARYMASGELELVMDSTRTFGGEIHAVWPQSRYLPSKARAAIDALADELPASMWQGLPPMCAVPD